MKIIQESDRDYRRRDGISNSALKAICRSPLHYKAALERPQSDTPALAFGRLVHGLVLLNDPGSIAIKPDGMSFVTKEGKAWKAEMIAAGKDIHSQEDWANALGIQDAVSSHEEASRLLDLCEHREITVTNTLADMLCKGRLDAYSPKNAVILDLKTCEDASPSGFISSIRRYRYDRQVAFYSALTEEKCNFWFIAVEKEPPYAVGIYGLRFDTIKHRIKQIITDLQIVRSCESTGIWPGYGTKIIEAADLF
jgi:exodeoxyribonuclease VIII